MRAATEQYRYSRKAIADAAGPAVIAILAPVVPFIFIAPFRLFGIGLPEFEFDRLDSLSLTMMAAGWVFLIVTTIWRPIVYLHKYTVSSEGIRCQGLLGDSFIAWKSVSAVAIQALPTGQKWGPKTESSIVIRSAGRTYMIYESLSEFELFKSCVVEICTQRNIQIKTAVK